MRSSIKHKSTQEFSRSSLELVARRVLNLEKNAIESLSAAIDADFLKALEVCLQSTGRIIVTGMGKSGHIARKIAATLSSTGTPAYFVHPGEASHGDLGMIAASDCVLALSNSGESHELGDLIHYCSRFKIPLIAITQEAKSSLGKAADYLLLLPKHEEACPMGLAPTTSTTMMMALGDAFAVCLLEMRGFTKDDFQLYHPGGQIGKMLLSISDIMHTGADIPLATQDIEFSQALLIMTEKSLGCLGIVDKKGKLVGMITDGDLRRHMSEDLLKKKVVEIMTHMPLTIQENMLVSEAITLFNEHEITNLFVVDEKHQPVGVLHLHDCLRSGVK